MWDNDETALLFGEGLGTTTYKGMTITYSGYNGDGTNYGNEFITVKVTATPLTMKAFGYAAGEAQVDYAWDYRRRARCGRRSTMRRLSFRWLSALILLSSLSLSACSSDDEETNNEPPISDACGNSVLDGIETCDDGTQLGVTGAALRVRLKRLSVRRRFTIDLR